MVRGLIVFLILAAIAGFFAWRYHAQEQAVIAQQSHQIDDLSAQISKLKADDNQLHDQLDKVQEENGNLKIYNDALKKALEQAKVTGKVPLVPPYPPK
jgi:predicted negative regulator of RcsB-dependent stress response